VADNVELHLWWRLDFEEGLQPDFEIAHGHDAVDGSLAEFLGESEDVRGDRAQVAILLFQAVEVPAFAQRTGLRSSSVGFAPRRYRRTRVARDAPARCDRRSRRPRTCGLTRRFGRGVEMVTGVPESAVDHGR
jgi:hypothetical protein